MKTEDLIALGLTEEQANKVFAMHGKAINAQKQKVTDAEAERDSVKSQLETANATLEKFKGIDPEKIQDEIQTYKTQAEEAQKNFSRQMTQRDQRDWITQKLDEYGVASPYARKQLIAECMADEGGLPWKEGAFLGFDDFMKSAKEKDSNLYQTAEEKAAAEKAAAEQKKAPAFTGAASGGGEGGADKKFTPPKIF